MFLVSQFIFLPYVSGFLSVESRRGPSALRALFLSS